MKKLLTVILLAISISIPGVLTASEPDDYVTLKAGWFWPNSSSNGLKDFKQAPAYEFNYGRRFGNNFSAELGGIYYLTKYDGKVSPENFKAGSSTDIEVSFYGPMATLKGIIHPIDELEVFIGGGAGYYWSNTVIKKTRADDTKVTGTGVGWHVVAGSSYRIISKLAVGLEGKYIVAKLDADEFAEKTDFGGILALIYLKYMF
jgi:opacity protein-like surface antigen